MGCGSSKSAVAIISTTDEAPTTKTQNIENFNVKTSVKNDETDANPLQGDPLVTERHSPTTLGEVKNAFVEEVCQNNISDLNNKENHDSSSGTLRINSRDKSATSMGSKDSGVFDERIASGRSQHSSYSSASGEGSNSARGSAASVKPADISNRKPPSGSSKSSSARRKLLRIEDDSLSDSQPAGFNSPDEIIAELNFNECERTLPPLLGQNITLRPKSRFGNVAFDIVLDTPETGNAKKRPDKLVSLNGKTKKSKKVKTKRDIDTKMQEADARRKIQENEKLLKARQFQHFSVTTTVEPFNIGDGNFQQNTQQENQTRTRNKGKNWVSTEDANNNNDNNNTVNNRYNEGRTVAKRSSESILSNSINVLSANETMVVPFKMEDEDELNSSKHIMRMSVGAVAAC